MKRFIFRAEAVLEAKNIDDALDLIGNHFLSQIKGGDYEPTDPFEHADISIGEDVDTRFSKTDGGSYYRRSK